MRKWDGFAIFFVTPWRIEGGATGEEKLFADALEIRQAREIVNVLLLLLSVDALEIRQAREGNLLFDDTIATPDAALVVTPAAGRQDNRA